MRSIMMLILVAGCYAQVNGGYAGPTRHGYGGAGGEVRGSLGVGGAGAWGGVGAGIAMGYLPGNEFHERGVWGLTADAEVNLATIADSPRSETHLSLIAGAEAGATPEPAEFQRIPDGFSYRQLRLGLGVQLDGGSRDNDARMTASAGIVLTATRIDLEYGRDAWFYGIAFVTRAFFNGGDLVMPVIDMYGRPF